MTNAAPCGEGGPLCINTTVPCVDKNDPMCQNATQQQKEVSVSMPCFTNLTVDVNLLNETGPVGQNHKYCVTTMAVAGPEYKNCTPEIHNQVEGYRSVLAGKNRVKNGYNEEFAPDNFKDIRKNWFLSNSLEYFMSI